MEFDKKIKEKSKISIILPNYNSSKYIEETLSSILNQSFKDWRLIIIDDNSNFETKKILEKFKNNKQINIILLNKNKGAGYCRNLGIQISNSEYISFIDSDDTWEAEKLEEQFNFMKKNEYDFTYTQYSTFKMNNEKKILKKITPPKKMSYESFINDTSISTSSMMLKKKVIGETKFSDSEICEDYFFKCEILKKVNYAFCLEKKLTNYRIRENSLQSNKLKNLFWVWKINKNLNKLSTVRNLISVISISVSSFKRYGLK